MSAQHDGGIDWTPILAGVVSVLTAIGGTWAIITNGFRQRKVDKASETEKTIENIWDIVKGLKEEREHDQEQIDKLQKEKERLRERIDVLEAKVAELEAIIAKGA